MMAILAIESELTVPRDLNTTVCVVSWRMSYLALNRRTFHYLNDGAMCIAHILSYSAICLAVPGTSGVTCG